MASLQGNDSTKSKIEAAMFGILPHTPSPDESMSQFSNISIRNYDPPAYIVSFVLFSVLSFHDNGGDDKITWHTYFEYENHAFLIRDYKFGTWSIESNGDLTEARKLLPAIKRKLISASRLANELLKSEFQKMIDKGFYYLNNTYPSLQRSYSFYREQAESIFDDIVQLNERTDKPQSLEQVAELYNHRLERQELLSYYVVPMITAFFSMQEFLFDVFNSFRQSSIPPIEFRKMPWHDRFKHTFELHADKEIKDSYDALSSIRRNYRNPMNHGNGDDCSLLVSLPTVGLVPVSYEHLKKSIHFDQGRLTTDEVGDILDAFASFVDFVETTEPYSYFMRFAEYGFAIPVEQNAVRKITREMTDPDEFERYLEGMSLYQDALMNREI